MRGLIPTTRFRRDVKRLKKRGLDITPLNTVVHMLVHEVVLVPSLYNHPLKGEWSGYYECHIANDFLLIYKIIGNEIELARTGTHADLFGM